MTTDVEILHQGQLDPNFKILFPEHPVYSLLRTKAGIIGRPIRETHGDVMDQVAARSGVIRVSNGFRCPDNMSNGGTFTDATGSTCGVRVVAAAVEGVVNLLQNGIGAGIPGDEPDDSPISAGIRRIQESADETSRVSRMAELGRDLTSLVAPEKSPSRIRFTTEELIPEAVEINLGSSQVDAVRSRRPAVLFGKSRKDFSTLPYPEQIGIDDEDLESDSYIRSLGAAILTEISSDSSRVSKRLEKLKKQQEEIRRRQEEAFLKYDALLNEVDPEVKRMRDEINKILAEIQSPYSPVQGWRIEDPPKRFVGGYGVMVDGIFSVDPADKVGVKDSDLISYAKYEFDLFPGDSDSEGVTIQIIIPTNPQLKVPYGLSDDDIVSLLSNKRIEPRVRAQLWANSPEAKLRHEEIGFPHAPNSTGTSFFDTTEFYDEDAVPGSSEWVAMALGEYLTAGYMPGSEKIEASTSFKNLIEIERQVGEIEPEMLLQPSGDPTEEMRDLIIEHLESIGFQRGKFLEEDIGQDPDFFYPMNISSHYTSDEAEQLKEALMDIGRFFPEEWIQLLLQDGVRFMRDRNPDKRAYAAQRVGEVSLPARYFEDPDVLRSVLFHELTHLIQARDPELEEAEFVFFRRRITDEDIVSPVKLADLYPGSSYEENELTYPDDTDNAYAFKRYNHTTRQGGRPISISEISTLGAENFLGKRATFAGDLDHATWMLGILAEAGFRPPRTTPRPGKTPKPKVQPHFGLI